MTHMRMLANTFGKRLTCWKKRALRRLKLSSENKPSPIKRLLRLERVNVKAVGRPSKFKEKVEHFMLNDKNSIVVPDLKKAKKILDIGYSR